MSEKLNTQTTLRLELSSLVVENYCCSSSSDKMEISTQLPLWKSKTKYPRASPTY